MTLPRDELLEHHIRHVHRREELEHARGPSHLLTCQGDRLALLHRQQACKLLGILFDDLPEREDLLATPFSTGPGPGWKGPARRGNGLVQQRLIGTCGRRKDLLSRRIDDIELRGAVVQDAVD